MSSVSNHTFSFNLIGRKPVDFKVAGVPLTVVLILVITSVRKQVHLRVPGDREGSGFHGNVPHLEIESNLF